MRDQVLSNFRLIGSEFEEILLREVFFTYFEVMEKQTMASLGRIVE